MSWWQDVQPSDFNEIANDAWYQLYFRFTVPGRLFGCRYFASAGDSTTHWAIIDNPDTTAVQAFVYWPTGGQGPGTRWRNRWIHPKQRVIVGDMYRVSVLFSHFTQFWTGVPSGVVIPNPNNGLQWVDSGVNTNLNPLNTPGTSLGLHIGIDVLFQPD